MPDPPPPYMRPRDEPRDARETPAHKAPRRHMWRTGSSGQPPYVPSAKVSKRVRALAMLGLSRKMIAQDAGIDVRTLEKYYGRELDQGDLEAYAQVAGRLFQKAMGGDTIAMIFWMKARIGWKDRPDQIQHNHTVTVSHEERLRLLEAGPDQVPGQVLDQDDEDEDEEDQEEGEDRPEPDLYFVRPRYTETGAQIIDADDFPGHPHGPQAEEEGDPDPMEGEALKAAEEMTIGYAEQVARAKGVERDGQG